MGSVDQAAARGPGRKGRGRHRATLLLSPHSLLPLLGRRANERCYSLAKYCWQLAPNSGGGLARTRTRIRGCVVPLSSIRRAAQQHTEEATLQLFVLTLKDEDNQIILPNAINAADNKEAR